MALEDTDVWLGRFDSVQRWQEYLEEHYDEDRDNQPLSQFAADQGETFYDHDWIEGEFTDKPRSGSEQARLTELIRGFSWAESYLGAVIADAMQAPLVGANAAISLAAGEISDPRLAVGDDYELRYIGRYQRTPRRPDFDPEARELSLNYQRLTEVPPEVFQLTGLLELSLAGNALISIPEGIGRLRNLEEIYLWENQLTTLPDELFMLPKLRKIMAQNNALRSLPTGIGAAQRLERLTASRNRLTYLPDEVGDLNRLTLLDIGGNELTNLPASIGRLTELHTLRIGGNEITRLPDEITAVAIEDQLSLPQFFDKEAQSPAVQSWLAQPRRRQR